MDDPPESPEHSHTPANAALDPESSFLGVNSVLASSSRANPPFTESNSCRRRLSLTGSRFGDPSLDLLSDHSDSSILHHHSQFVHHPIFESAHTNYETGEMATGLPPLSLEQTREGHQIKERVDLQLRDRVLHERSYISQSTFFPQVDQNQHGINTFGLQFKDIQPNATTSGSSFHNRPENTFRWCTDYNSQVQEPVSIHNSVAPMPIFDQRPPKPDNAPGFGNLSSSSPKSRKTSLNTTTGNNSDVHCKCTKTSCLKLYCECFSAETYCDDLCTCHGCMNREDYEDTVEDTKEKIAIRKPNAFRPKIQHGDGTGFTTSLARHKRGCNCKKSKCLKKYCECYQANVGCCDVCRCENCENTHGKKDEYLAKKHEMVAPQEALLVHNDLSSIPHNLAPTVSPFQFSNYAEVAPNSRHEPGPIMAATPYGINHPIHFPLANNVYGVNDDELMRSGTRFNMQHVHPVGGDPMNQFLQNVNGFGIPNPENWLNNNYNTTNAGILFSHNGQIPSANAQMLLGNGQIPTTVNPFDTEEGEEENVFNGSAAAGGVYNIPANNSSRDAAHQMLEESPAPHPNEGVQVMSFGNRRVSVHSHETQTPTPVNSITSSSFSGEGEMSGYNYLLRGDPSSKGFDGHTAKKD